MLLKSLSIALLFTATSSVSANAIPSVPSTALPSVPSTSLPSVSSTASSPVPTAKLDGTQVEGYLIIWENPQYDSKTIGECFPIDYKDRGIRWQNLSNRNATFYKGSLCELDPQPASNLNSTYQMLSGDYKSWKFV
ncbi:hypothetical protein BD408DRAFT_429256 [Parasitella parasitica]|nr:hypothetical protein BD408DRAFT_429256 [Parasitella parasitica]